MRRLVLVPAGLLMGFAMAAAVLAAGLLAEALAAPPEASWGIARVVALFLALSSQTGDATAFAAGAVWRALLWVCLAPLCLVAMAAEASRLRSWRWLAGGTGSLAGLAPTILHTFEPGVAAAPLSPFELRLSLLLLLSGVAGGTLFWLVAGRRDAARA